MPVLRLAGSDVRGGKARGAGTAPLRLLPAMYAPATTPFDEHYAHFTKLLLCNWLRRRIFTR